MRNSKMDMILEGLDDARKVEVVGTDNGDVEAETNHEETKTFMETLKERLSDRIIKLAESNINIYHKGVVLGDKPGDANFVKIAPDDKMDYVGEYIKVFIIGDDKATDTGENLGVTFIMNTKYGIAHLVDCWLHMNDYDFTTDIRNEKELTELADEVWICTLESVN